MNDVKYAVPWVDQWGTGADVYKDDCFQACLLMMLLYWGITQGLTVDQIAAFIPPVSGTSCANGAKIAAAFGADARVETLTPSSILAHLDAGRMIIPLIASQDISNRQDRGIYLHFIVLIGHTANGDFYANDPDRLFGSAYGAGMVITQGDLIKSIADAKDITGKNNQGVVMYGKQNIEPDHAAIINDNEVHVRITPGLTGRIIASLNSPAPVWVLKDTPQTITESGVTYTWKRVQLGNMLIGWVADKYLNEVVVTPPPLQVMYTTTGVNLRSSPGIPPVPSSRSNIIRTLPINTRVKIDPAAVLQPDAHDHTISWAKATTDLGEVGYIDYFLLSTTPQVIITPVPPPKPTSNFHIGLHFVYESTFEALTGVVNQLPNLIPIITMVNHPDRCRWIKQHSPNTIVINRVELGYTPPNTADGGDWFGKCREAIEAAPEADIHELACEHNSDNPTFLARFYDQMIDAAVSAGKIISVGDLASGTPKGDLDAAIKIMLPMLQKAAFHKMKMVYHCYSPATPQGFIDLSDQAEWFVLRYKKFQIACPGLGVYGGEGGTGSPNVQPAEMDRMKQLNSLVDIPVSYWSVGRWTVDGGASDITPFLPQYVQWRLASN